MRKGRLLTAFLLSMDKRPSVEEATRYYEHTMTKKVLMPGCWIEEY